MSDLPEFARDATETAKSRVRSALGWLRDPYPCQDCGASCTASREFVESQAMTIPVWRCPECQSRYYRVESDGFSTDPYR